jgi:DDE superfamily endonuclease
MDNASAHHFRGLWEMVEARYVPPFLVISTDISFRGMHLLYLPPYSPDFNPIKEGFSAMKSWIRRNRDYVLGEMTGGPVCDPYAMLWDLVFVSMTPEKIAGWYRDSGYH